MILEVLGSESAGNCYLLRSDGGEVLIIEAGIRLQTLKESLGFNLSNVVGCLVSHQHGDHAKYGIDYMKAAISIYTTAPPLRWEGKARMTILRNLAAVSIGGFSVMPFPVDHDVPCSGFLIYHMESGTIMFATDTCYIKNKFKGLNHIMIEANYSDETLHNDRAVGRHMALDTVVGFLESNDISNVRNIILLHLSSGNSDSEMFKKTIAAKVPGSVVSIADKGLIVNLSRYPF